MKASLIQDFFSSLLFTLVVNILTLLSHVIKFY